MKEDLQRQLVSELVVESLEGLDAFDQEVLAFERGERNADLWHNAFRIIHTIKGSSGCVGFAEVEKVAHAGENLLSELRDGSLQPDPGIASSLLKYSDALREMMHSIEQTGAEGDADHTLLIQDLQALHTAVCGKTSAPPAFGFFDDEPASAAAAGTPRPNSPADATAVKTTADTAIRVDVSQIDRLMNLVGELVLARNQILQTTAQQADSTQLAAVQRINLITGELQESVMKTRMQPIANVWSKFPRVVRDLCHELGKDVALTMEGNETELDRTIIEAIKDPLMHIVRNAVDHGIEPPADRAAAGKPARGVLSLRAFHEGGQVNIEIADDGRGIDVERVLQKAIQRGHVTAEQAASMSQREVLALTFLPGISTAGKVTNVSGRGVGMDVVRNNIEKIGGNVDVHSERGKGTVLRLKIPLTLAIIPALIVTCGGERFAIPAACLVELVRIESEQAAKAIEHIHNAPVYRLRGNLLPLVYLDKELDLRAARRSEDAVFLIVLQAEGTQFGLVVDNIHDTEEIVVKPLGKEMKGLTVYAGATIMGDGRVALILDVLGLARRSLLLEETGRQATRKIAAQSDGSSSELRSLLVARVGRNRVGIPLACIARLEEIPAGEIELAGHSEVIQYRGRIMNVVRLSSVLGTALSEGEETRERLPMVVCAIETNNVGLVVDAIDDIVEEKIHVEVRKGQRGVLGSAVVRKQVTDLLDVGELAGLAA